MIVLLLALIGGVGYLLATQLGDDGSAATIPVPDVVGQPVAEAQLHLAAQKLTKVTVVRRANDQFAQGLVVRQDPSAGTKVGQDENILLTVSDGAGSVKVPDVVGETFEDAATTLQAKGLNAVRVDEASDSVPLGQVISTNPPADATVKRNSDVQVFVSAGPAPVNVPNVDGQGPGRGRADPDRRRAQVPEDEHGEQHRPRGLGHQHQPGGRDPGTARLHRHDERVDRAGAGDRPQRGRQDPGRRDQHADRRARSTSGSCRCRRPRRTWAR